MLQRYEQLSSQNQNGTVQNELMATHSLANTVENNPGQSSQVRVYLARYDYNPYDGPNNCPELELFLSAGEYVYVSGSADQDGFYFGETTDGRRGLVPGNYLELVPNLAAPPYRTATAEVSNGKTNLTVPHTDSLNRVGTGIESPVSKAFELFELDGKAIVPFPRQIRVDKKLQHSLLISWVAPKLSGEENVIEYRIDVNEQLKTIVDGEKSSAVVENIHDSGTYRISVSAVLAEGVSSDPIRCTLLYGTDVAERAAPVLLRLEAVNSSSCVMSWLPVNSNFRHRVSVNGVERETLPAGFYRTRLTNLEPDRQYVMMVEPVGTDVNQQSSSTSSAGGQLATLKVRTRPPGPPDPPQSPVIEEDQINQKNVLIRWLPVTLTGTSNGTPIRGYAVYQNGKMLDEVVNPSGDRISVLRSQIKPGSKITVRTITVDGEMSIDSGLAKPYSECASVTPPNSKMNLPGTMTGASHHPSLNHPGATAAQRLIGPNSAPLSIQGGLPAGFNDSLGSSYFAPDHSRRDPLQSRTTPSNYLSWSRSEQMPGQAPLPGQRAGPNRQRSPNLPPPMHVARNRSSYTIADEFSNLNMGLSHYPDRRIRSADFESENDEWLRHTIDRHISRASGNLPDAQKESWNRSLDRRRAHSMPRKAHMNQGVGLLDAYPDHIPRSRTQQRGPTSRPFMGAPPMYDYELDPREQPSYLKDQPNVFERLRTSEQYSDYILSDSEPSLSSMSSWGRRSPSSSKRRTHAHHSSSNRHSNSFSMHDISNSYNQFPSYHQPRGRSPTEKTHHRSRKKELNPQEKLRRQNKPRLFVALYDYDPLSQSPNDDAVEVELSFRVGQLIKIFGEKDEDGFFKGATRDGHRGLVPCNHIAEVDVPNSSTMESLYEKGFLNSDSEKISTRQSKPKFKAPRGQSQGRNKQVSGSPLSERNKKMNQGKKGNNGVGDIYVAVYDYNPSLTSPNVDTRDEELKLQKGDVVRVLGPLDYDGFFYAEVNGRRGFVPSNFLQLQNKPKSEAKMNKSEKK